MTPEEFQEHIVFQRLNSLEELLSNDELVDHLELERLAFFKSAYEFINQKVKLIIPTLVRKAEIDGLSTELNASIKHLNDFINTNNQSYLNNASNNIINAISKSRNLPIITVHNDFDFSKEIADFEKNVSNKYKLLEQEKDKLEVQIDRLNQVLSDQQTEVKRLLTLIEGKEAEIQNLNSAFQTNFENIESKHNQQFKNALQVYRNEFDKSKKQYREEIEEVKNALLSDASTTVSELETKLDEAKRLVNLIGNVGITGNYQNIANSHKKYANWWSVGALAFMAFFSALLVWAIVDLNSDSFDWIRSLLRIIAAAALSYPATYAARESTRHRKLETINRNAELELASINPFIEDLDKEKKQAIKEKLVEKYFGNNNSDIFSDKDDNEKLSIKDVKSLLETLLKSRNE